MTRNLIIAITMFVLAATASAQTDCTSLITNPSFEEGLDGWEHKSLGTQDNSIFSIKSGNIYLEKWTGRGSAVGSASVSQELQDLPPGNYELTAAAQNIQEDTPTAAQTGTWIFAGDKKSTVTIRDTYTVAFTHVSGNITIGFEAVNASGNWIAVDNFCLTLISSDLSAELNSVIEQTTATYGNATGQENQQLKDAIEAARSIAAKVDATTDEQAAAIVAINEATDIYLRANASADNPLDMTSLIKNPSFETGDLTGWKNEGMATQANNVFSIKQGTWYVERWTGRGGAVGDARLSQKLINTPAGRYRLTAAAQNIQEDTPNAAQTGAWIFAGTHTKAVTVRGTYTLEFVQAADVMEIGFEAEGATGNWLAVDNFKLEYISDDLNDVRAELAALIAKAQAVAAQRINSTAQQALNAAIEGAQAALNADSGIPAASTALEEAYATAVASQEVFARLATAIANANIELSDPTATLKDDYRAAINTAQGIYNAETTTDEQAEAAIAALAEATFAFKVLNGTSSGTPPTVTTDPRFIRGCTWAFGRSTVSGSNILEEGFCWSEQPDPKVTDHRTTEYINQAGKIYWLRDLKPATIYYMRAYAITKDYAVGYGDVIKVVTVPKGTVGHWYNNGGDEATNDRINYAINLSMDYYWNNLTSIHDFGISVNYSPGTPTADCSYGGWMRVGESASYQQPGTIMHEAFHGIGVGQHSMWWNGEMRAGGNRGVWLGDRVTEAVRFWDNSATAVIDGDDMHLWPYGCNGAHEDTHSDNLYCMMGILAQALNEDGLPASAAIGYALPYYAFNHEEGVKYYIKNEDENRGLHSAYLVETTSHTLQWKTMDAEEALENDAAAWYLTFTPGNQYYQLRNAATGYYMTYSSGIKTAMHATPTAADNFHLMRGRVDVEGHRGYYIIHPESSANPPVLNAAANGNTATAQWNIAKSATTQRWLILTADEALNFDNGNLDQARTNLANLLAHIRQFTQLPHTEDVADADATLNSQLSSIESQATACTRGSEVSALTTQAWSAAATFLSGVSATDAAQPFDLTFLLENPDFDDDAISGWTSTNGTPGYDAKGAEFYEKTFDFYQILSNMPVGTYELRANAFQRPGSAETVYTAYSNGTAKVTTSLYINKTTAAVHHICDDRQSKALFNDGGWGSDVKMSDNTYIPNCMVGAEAYFAKNLYDSSVSAELKTTGSSLRVGIKCTSAPSYYWTMFDHFRLYFFGGAAKADGVAPITIRPEDPHDFYTIDGRKVNGSPTAKGIYIVNGKKVIWK